RNDGWKLRGDDRTESELADVSDEVAARDLLSSHGDCSVLESCNSTRGVRHRATVAPSYNRPRLGWGQRDELGYRDRRIALEPDWSESQLEASLGDAAGGRTGPCHKEASRVGALREALQVPRAPGVDERAAVGFADERPDAAAESCTERRRGHCTRLARR